MTELIDKLSQGKHRVTFRPIRGDALEELAAAVERRYVHLNFTETRGGTELGFPLDDDRSDLSSCDLKVGTGALILVGDLNLDGTPVRCHATLDLESMEGQGHLEVLENENRAS